MDKRLALEIESHRRTSEALWQSEETVQALLNATTETALLIDSDGRILALNQVAYERIRRLSPVRVGDRAEDLIGLCVFDLFPIELAETRKARNDLVLHSGLPARFEDHREGRWMDNSIYPVFDSKGNVNKLAIFSYDVTERKVAELTLNQALRAEQDRARRDPLTGVLNHLAIVEELQALLANERPGATHAVAMIDVDGLKDVNDTHGHRLGDAVLVAVADALSMHDAIVGRYGGDEFVAIIPKADRTRAEEYRRAVEATLKETEVDDELSGVVLPVSASIGLAVHPDDASAVNQLIEFADTRMYAAKRQRPYIRPRRAGARSACCQQDEAAG